MDTNSTVEPIRRFLTDLPVKTPSRLTLARSLNEVWLSNTLAWLLNPRGSHGLGTRFAEAFAVRIGKRRTEGKGAIQYCRRSTFLKSGRAGEGTGATGFRFNNSSVIREFYLTKAVKGERRGPRYCDLAFFDLDLEDDFFLVIENKPFSTPSWRQLRCYQGVVEERYKRVAIREYVLLTLRDDVPVVPGADAPREKQDWVRLSWTGDVLHLLEDCRPRGTPRPAVLSLMKLLRWADCLTDPARLPEEPRTAFRNQLVRAAAECLHEELTRLHEEGGGSWLPPSLSGRSAFIRHSTHGVSNLRVKLLPGLSVVVDGRAHGRQTFDKIIVPFGAHPDQVFNLLDLAAREVYWQHFANPKAVLGGGRRRAVTRGEAKFRHERLFRFVHRHQQALKILLRSLPMGSAEPEEDDWA